MFLCGCGRSHLLAFAPASLTRACARVYARTHAHQGHALATRQLCGHTYLSPAINTGGPGHHVLPCVTGQHSSCSMSSHEVVARDTLERLTSKGGEGPPTPGPPPPDAPLPPPRLLMRPGGGGGGRRLLGAADTQTAHPATFSTVPTHQLLGSANAETTPARAPAAVVDRKQRPDATCEGKNG